MIRNLRQNEEVMLYANILDVTEEESIKVIDFLNSEYQTECFDYSFEAPSFNSKAALWSAKLIYIASQLMLYRENKEADLEKLIPDFNGDIQESEILSADLCLRFLPSILIQLKLIDPEDVLIDVLEKHLKKFHYSGINYAFEKDNLEFKHITESPTLQQLYINRIIDYKNIQLAKHPQFKSQINALLGNYAKELWSEFKTEITDHE